VALARSISRSGSHDDHLINASRYASQHSPQQGYSK
jgi:hypothetical protein